ncbi:hypothetical protein NQ314_003784 [Rhamnusium bicolor]|uniref:POPLD domain-containing protein n=1 Tax=Rhamnusium bicolor TaxID=1586634 RepID=A0AAV8ZNY6_9CUCU|nr:hypothetical protein NQ314_003784 [Rhamnusium bicolor]
MWGARVGGLRETDSIAFEMNEPYYLYPDTAAGTEEEICTSNEAIEKFFRLPPNNRTNYNKFRISSPFKLNWKLLLSEWNESQTPIVDFFVLRNKKILGNIQVGNFNVKLLILYYIYFFVTFVICILINFVF